MRRALVRKENESDKEIKKKYERKQNRETIKDDKIDLSKFFALAPSDKKYANSLNLHEIKKEILLEQKCDYKLNGLLDIGPVKHKTNIGFKKMDDFESYINVIGIDYDSGVKIFTGYVYKIGTHQLKVVKRSAYAKGTNYMQEIVEYHGQNCYIPTSGHCFIKCNNYFTGKDFTEDFFTFIRTEKNRSGIMASAIFQPFCRKHNINIGCFDGTRKYPRNITERDIALKIHKNLFCFFWKSQRVSFNKAIGDQLKPNFKVVDNVISDKDVRSGFEYECKPKKVHSPLTNIVVYDLETFNKDRAIPYCICIYELSIISGKYHRDTSEKEHQKYLNDCIVFKGSACNNETFDEV